MPIRAAADVISRLRWDRALRALPTEWFAVGYIDRFLGGLEQPFSAFSWEELATIDGQNGIQYFAYRGKRIWEEASRLDLVFGSQGEGRGLIQEMQEVDAMKEYILYTIYE
jgi:hypothetical protein